MEWKQDENDSKPGIYVSDIDFGNGTWLSNIGKSDIVVFVGANNVGKSQILRDISNTIRDGSDTVVIKNMTAFKSVMPYDRLVQQVGSKDNMGHYYVMGKFIDTNNISWQLSLNAMQNDTLLNLFVCTLDTEKRLTICYPAPTIDRDEPKTNPIHYVAFDSGIRKKLSDYFYRAFNKYIRPDRQYGKSIPLFILEELIDFGDKKFNDETERTEAYADELNKNPQVQLQGDGIKSFIGILLYLMLDFYRIYLIDELEAFLHPPQAKVMGQMIGKLCSEDKQVFISTHSEHLIQGLLETAPDRVKIVRITREGNTNYAFILDTNEIKEFWSDSILKHSNIMESLFYKNVVLCESDSDCRFYSIINDFMQEKKGKYPETLFISSGGKQRIPVIMNALTSLGVDTKVIADFDVLDNATIFKRICESCNINLSSLGKEYDDFYDKIGRKEKLPKKTKQEFLLLVKNVCADKENEKNFSDEEVKEIKDALKEKSYWHKLKQSGVNALTDDDKKAEYLFEQIDKIAKKHQLFIVPVGEIECFVKTVAGHGPSWVNRVLEQYPKLEDPVYDEVKKFIGLLDL